jgi:hypothetical protein
MKRTALVFAAVLGCVLAACHGKPSPVGRLDVQPRALTLASGEAVTVHLTWTPTAALSEAALPPIAFVHLLDGRGKLLRTFDQAFMQAWAEGSTVNQDVRVFQSALAPPLAPGSYRLSVGLYQGQGNKRYALEGLGEPIGRSEYLAATVQIPATSDAPRIAYSNDWLPVDAGTDRQVLARRWLAEAPGTVRVDEIHGAGLLWMELYIPATGNEEKLALNPGATGVPAVMVRSSCGGNETSISGPGIHGVEMPIESAGPDGCTVTLTPNFHIDAPVEPKVRSVALQILAWMPGAPKPAASGS